MFHVVSKHFLLTVLLALSTLPARAGYIKLSASDVDIYYDAAFWGAGSATVEDNAISFSTVFTKSASPGNYSLNAFDSLGVFAVAHTGYALTGATTLGISGSYSLSSLGSAFISSTALIYSGSLANSIFVPDDAVGAGYVGASVAGTSKPGKGSFTAMSSSTEATGLYQAIGLQNILSAVAYPKLTSTSLTSTGFNFDVTAVSAVPEINASGMSIAGLLLVGTMVLRRKQSGG
jgi:hypothetical protein